MADALRSFRRFSCSGATIILLWGTVAMADSPNVTVFGAAPLPPDKVAAKLEMMVKEGQLGSAIDRLMKRGEISIGFAQISIPPTATSNQSNGAKAASSQYNHYLVVLPFTVHPAYEGTHYRRIVVRVHLSDRSFIAYDLLPKSQTVARTEKIRYEFLPEFKFREIEIKAGSVSREVAFERLYPVITSFGIGESDFYWVHEGEEANGEVRLVEGSTGVAISLQVPKGTKQVSATINYAAEMRYERLGSWRDEPASTGDYNFTWELPHS